MNKLVSGVDYSTGYTPSDRTRADWQRVISTHTKAGGTYRVERDNEGLVTFLHDPKGILLFEIHDPMGLPVTRRIVRHCRAPRIDQQEMSL